MRPSSAGRSAPEEGGSRRGSPESMSVAVSPAKLGQLTKNSMLATSFKQDLTGVKSICTCSICDEFLYEPFTISCGHTYCYSCLCSWFANNKSCPECRTRVKTHPAPNFIVKHIVAEILIKRAELMPVDESLEQHTVKRQEEAQAVEDDKASDLGLFKGLFKPRPQRPGAEVTFDEEDGIMRCGACGHEDEGGQSCGNCGIRLNRNGDDDDASVSEDFSGAGWSDYSADELAELEFDMDRDLMDEQHGPHALFRHMAQHMHHAHHYHHNHHHHHDHQGDDTDRSISDSTGSEDGEDNSSMNDFIVPDDYDLDQVGRRAPPNNNELINLISDDESDEGGAIRSRPSQRASTIVDLRSPSIGESSRTSAPSEAADAFGELERAGWSPLAPDSDSESEPESDTAREAISELYSDGSYGFYLAIDMHEQGMISDSVFKRLNKYRRVYGYNQEPAEDDVLARNLVRRMVAQGKIPRIVLNFMEGGGGDAKDYTSDMADDGNLSSQTETINGRGGSDVSDRSSATPTRVFVPGHIRTNPRPSPGAYFGDQISDADDDESEAGYDVHSIDRDGDTDMSASPSADGSSRSASISNNPYSNPYQNYENQELEQSSRETSYASGYDYPVGNGPPSIESSEYLEQTRPTRSRYPRIPSPENSARPSRSNYFHEESIEPEAPSHNMSNAHQDSSDSSPIRPSNRRRRCEVMSRPVVHNGYTSPGPIPNYHNRYNQEERAQIAQARANNRRSRRPERANRSPSTMYDHPRHFELIRSIHQSSRRNDPLRSSRSPSVARVDTSSRYHRDRPSYRVDSRPRYREDNLWMTF